MSNHFPCCLVFISKLFISLNEKAMKCGLFPNSAYMGKEDLCAYSLLAQQAKSNCRNVCVWTLHAGVQLHSGRGFDTKRMEFDSNACIARWKQRFPKVTL